MNKLVEDIEARQARKRNGFDTVHNTRPLGFHLTCSKGHPRKDGEDLDPDEKFVMVMTSWRDGQVFWEDQLPKNQLDQLVVEKGLFGRPEPGYNRYTSIMVLDQRGCVGTFTSSSWAGHFAVAALVPHYQLHDQRDFPIASLGTKPRNDKFGNVDPIFHICGWAPREKFSAITGDTPQRLALEWSGQTEKTTSQIVDDEIPQFDDALPF
jgi:hypothetical protein